MRVAIIGTGAIGGIVAAHATALGLDVTAIDPWFKHVEAMRNDGLEVEGPDDHVHVRINALHLDELDSIEQEFDAVIVSVKSYDTEWAVRLMAPYLSATGVFVSAQNGINEERMLRYVPPRQLIGCVVTLAAELDQPGHIRRTLGREWPAFTIGELDGSPSGRVQRLAEWLSSVGEVRETANIWGELWSKLTLNSMTNGTSGASGFTTRLLWSDHDLVQLAIGIASETASVAAGVGVEMEPVFGRIEAQTLEAAHAGAAGAREHACAQLAEIGGTRVDERENRPSLLQDILRGRRTEIDYLNGYVARRAAEIGRTAPLNKTIADIVRQVELGVLKPDPSNLTRLIGSLD